MKIGYVTTMPSSNENKRIREEVIKLGHEFTQYDLADMQVKIKQGKVVGNDLVNSKDDILIVRGILGSLKTITAIVNFLKTKGIKVFDNNFLIHQYSISKITDMVKLTLGDVLIPDTFNISDFSDFKKAAKQLGYPMIIKSTRTGKGRGVYKVDDKSELEQLTESLLTAGKKAKHYLLQEYIPYVKDIRALIIGKKVYAMRRIPGEGEFRANFSLGGSVEPLQLDGKTISLAIKALSAVDMSVGGVDILETKEGKKYVLEVNHNAGFTGMEKATAENVAKVFVEHAIKNAKS